MSSVFLSADEVTESLGQWERSRAEDNRLVDEEYRNPFGRHRWVKLKDLRNRPEWNGQYAEILRQVETADDDRFEVRRLSVTNGSTAAIKRVNLDPIPDEDTVKVCRMSCSGEEHFLGGFRQTVRWPKAILQDSRHYPSVSCPIAAKLGFPLRIAKVRPALSFEAGPIMTTSGSPG